MQDLVILILIIGLPTLLTFLFIRYVIHGKKGNNALSILKGYIHLVGVLTIFTTIVYVVYNVSVLNGIRIELIEKIYGSTNFSFMRFFSITICGLLSGIVSLGMSQLIDITYELKGKEKLN